MMRRVAIAGLSVLLGVGLRIQAVAAEAEAAAQPYSGSVFTRSALTGDWLGTRNALAEKGITFDASVTQVTQGVVRGGKDSAWEYGGRGNLTGLLDTQKLGLWPGGFLNVEFEGNWANSSFEDLVQYNDGFRTGLIGTPEQIAQRIVAYKAAGADLILSGFLHFQEEVEYFGKRVLPLVRQLEREAGVRAA